ncbi:SulP family inorganic anion transporter [Variovorax brevis]|uniref:SulP family inorganic anion transporter n=1 Tax=Variovorax brevis TaxID=3053503 RepID=UPI0033657C79
MAEVTSGDNAASLAAACATLTLPTGDVLLLGGLMRLEFVANFISEPVLVGFKAGIGIGIVIVVDQLTKVLGIHVPKTGFVQHCSRSCRRLHQHRSQPWPWAPSAPLIAVAGGIASMTLLGLDPGASRQSAPFRRACRS